MVVTGRSEFQSDRLQSLQHGLTFTYSMRLQNTVQYLCQVRPRLCQLEKHHRRVFLYISGIELRIGIHTIATGQVKRAELFRSTMAVFRDTVNGFWLGSGHGQNAGAWLHVF